MRHIFYGQGFKFDKIIKLMYYPIKLRKNSKIYILNICFKSIKFNH